MTTIQHLIGRLRGYISDKHESDALYAFAHDAAAETASEAADRIESQAAEIAQLREALGKMLSAVCGEDGFAECVRRDSGHAYPWPALDLAEEEARAVLGEHKE